MSKLIDFLNAKSSHSPVWVSDSVIGFISNESGVAQIYSLDLESSEIKQLTFFKERVWSIASDQKNKKIIFTMDNGGDENEQIYEVDLAGNYKNLTNNKARNSFGGIFDNTLIMSSNARNAANFDIVALNLEDGSTEIIIKNDDNYNMPAAISNNNQYFVYNKLKAQSDNQFYLADLINKTAKLVPTNAEVAKYNSPVFSSDDKYLYYLSDANSDFEYVCKYDLANEVEENIYSEANWGIDVIDLSYDDRYLAMIVSEDGYGILKILDLETNELVDVQTNLKGSIFGFYNLAWSAFEHKVLFSFSSGSQVFDVYMYDLANNETVKLTKSSMDNLDKDQLVEPRLMHYESFDGLRIPFWLYKPKDKELKDLAILIEIHGGPEGQAYPMYEPINQYLVSNGIVVVEPNVRGSTGYGKKYTHLDDKGKRLDSVKDIEYLIKHLVNEGIGNKDKIAVSGTSYGGFMSLSVAARYPDLICCAVDNVGMFNLVTFLENTADYRRAHRESEYGVLASDREMLFEVSPVAKVDNIKKPLMVIHGANDPRVPVSEAEAVVDYLKNRDVEVEYLRYEDEGHGLAKLKNRLDAYPKMANFLKKHMQIK